MQSLLSCFILISFMENQLVKNEIYELTKSIKPYDILEQEHIKDVLAWISSGKDIFRIQKDANPPKHLVSYAVVVDVKEKKILLLDHKKAQLMLPSGGHIDKNELPYHCAKRELQEELNLSLEIIPNNQKKPFFITVTETVGISQKHTDVSLWYVFNGNCKNDIDTNSKDFIREFGNYYWLSFDEILNTDISKFDPHMHRFTNKIIKEFL